MNIGALQKFSLIEYPGKICAVIFTQGCNFRCPYCHNRELVDPDFFEPLLPEEDVFAFLTKRRGKLDAVTITGGEPSLQPDIVPFVARLKEMDYLVKIDSNGSCPGVLKELIRPCLVDYVAMDIKGPLEKYASITGTSVGLEKIRESIDLILSSGVRYEFRTTVVASLLDLVDLKKISALIPKAERYVLQKFIPSKTLDAAFLKESTYSDSEFREIMEEIRPLFNSLILR